MKKLTQPCTLRRPPGAHWTQGGLCGAEAVCVRTCDSVVPRYQCVCMCSYVCTRISVYLPPLPIAGVL